MKKQEDRKIIHVLTNNIPDKNYTGNKVLATGTIELLERYKQQLLSNGYEGNYSIEERENESYTSIIRFKGYNLVECEGLLYPKKNVDLAKEIGNKQLFHLKVLFENLNELKKTVTKEEQFHYEEVLKTITKKIEMVENESIQIKMI